MIAVRSRPITWLALEKVHPHLSPRPSLSDVGPGLRRVVPFASALTATAGRNRQGQQPAQPHHMRPGLGDRTSEWMGQESSRTVSDAALPRPINGSSRVEDARSQSKATIDGRSCTIPWLLQISSVLSPDGYTFTFDRMRVRNAGSHLGSKRKYHDEVQGWTQSFCVFDSLRYCWRPHFRVFNSC